MSFLLLTRNWARSLDLKQKKSLSLSLPSNQLDTFPLERPFGSLATTQGSNPWKSRSKPRWRWVSFTASIWGGHRLVDWNASCHISSKHHPLKSWWSTYLYISEQPNRRNLWSFTANSPWTHPYFQRPCCKFLKNCSVLCFFGGDLVYFEFVPNMLENLQHIDYFWVWLDAYLVAVVAINVQSWVGFVRREPVQCLGQIALQSL